MTKNITLILLLTFCNCILVFSQEAEDNLFQFEMEIGNNHFDNLIKKYNKDVDSIAGFLFYPIVKRDKINQATTFVSTRGLGIALCYWGEGVGLSPNRRRIEVFGFPAEKSINSLEKSISAFKKFDVNSCSTAQDSFFVITKGCTESVSDNDDKLTLNLLPIDKREHPNYQCDEFELVYLDFQTYKAFSTSNRFYPKNKVRGFNGLIIERALVNLDETPSEKDSCSLSNYRTLNVRPAPYPELSKSDDTDSSVAFSLRPSCPPHWRKKSFTGSQLTAVSMENIINLQSPVFYSESKPDEPKQEGDFHINYSLWTTGILLLFLLFMTIFAIRTNR